MSDVASVIGNCNTNPCFTSPVSTWRTFNGYPSGVTEENWVNSTQGAYTVVAEDEWGHCAGFLHGHMETIAGRGGGRGVCLFVCLFVPTETRSLDSGRSPASFINMSIENDSTVIPAGD